MHAKAKLTLKILAITFAVVVVAAVATAASIYFITKKYPIDKMLNEKVTVYTENFNNLSNKFDEFTYEKDNTVTAKTSNDFALLMTYYDKITDSTAKSNYSYLLNLPVYAKVNHYNIVVYNLLFPYFYNTKLSGTEQKPIKTAIANLTASADQLKDSINRVRISIANTDIFKVFESKTFPYYLEYIKSFHSLNNELLNALVKNNGIQDTYLLNNLNTFNIDFEIVTDFYLPNISLKQKTTDVPDDNRLTYTYDKLVAFTIALEKYTYNDPLVAPSLQVTAAYEKQFKAFTEEYSNFKKCVAKLTAEEKLNYLNSAKNTAAIVLDPALPDYNYAFVSNFLTSDNSGTFAKYLQDLNVTAYLIK